MNVEEWPFTEGFFKLETGHVGPQGWYFEFFEAKRSVLVSEDPSANIQTLILELQFQLDGES